MNFKQLVSLSVKQNASDLHLCSGFPPIFRIDGLLCPYGEQPVTGQLMSQWAAELLTEEQRQQLRRQGELDVALQLQEYRLRGNLFYQQNGLSAVYRHIAAEIPTLEQIGAPDVLARLAIQRDGLLLVCGATGSGKSSTLAAVLHHLNQTVARHIITLESPVEFIHHSQCCLIQQREVGRHVTSFCNGLNAALRQDPDIILLGELRDGETIRLALTAAETGHLVLASLHTRGAIQAVSRLVDVFPAEERAFVRSLLAESLRGVVAQQLLPGKGGGRIAVFEVMVGTSAVSSLIREGKGHQLLTQLQTGQSVGMQTMSQGVAQRQQMGLLS